MAGFYIDATDLMATFATEFQVQAFTKGHYGDDGIWVAGKLADPVTVNEPLVPQGSVDARSLMLTNLDVGIQTRYQAEWLSKGKYEEGTIVIHHGDRMVVRQADDYTDYSNLTIYYLDADTADQPEGATESA